MKMIMLTGALDANSSSNDRGNDICNDYHTDYDNDPNNRDNDNKVIHDSTVKKNSDNHW